MAERRSAVGAATGDDLESEAIALAFGATVHALRVQVGISLNELARRAGVDPAYIHRIESRGPTSRAARLASGALGAQRPPLPRRPVVTAIAAALGSDARQTDQLLALAGHTPTALAFVCRPSHYAQSRPPLPNKAWESERCRLKNGRDHEQTCFLGCLCGHCNYGRSEDRSC